jgi:hypothetical protein
MVRTSYDEQGRSLVEFNGDEIVYFEANLHGRAARDRLAVALEKDLLADRDAGKNTYSGEKIRRLAYEKAVKLVAEKAAEHERDKPLR